MKEKSGSSKISWRQVLREQKVKEEINVKRICHRKRHIREAKRRKGAIRDKDKDKRANNRLKNKYLCTLCEATTLTILPSFFQILLLFSIFRSGGATSDPHIPTPSHNLLSIGSSKPEAEVTSSGPPPASVSTR